MEDSVINSITGVKNMDNKAPVHDETNKRFNNGCGQDFGSQSILVNTPCLGDDKLIIISDSQSQMKRKPADNVEHNDAKVRKLDTTENEKISVTETLDEEVSAIIRNANERKFGLDDLTQPSTSRPRTPARASPRNMKRSNSSTDVTNTPKSVKSRAASADITRKTPQNKEILVNKSSNEDIPTFDLSSENCTPKPSVELAPETPPTPPAKVIETIAEETDTQMNDSQSFHLVFSPNEDTQLGGTLEHKPMNHSSDPVVVKDRTEVVCPGKTHVTKSEGYNYSDVSSNLSQPQPNKDKSTDQDSTDSVCSTMMESPDHIPTVASKLISKLSNGDSSTPTDQNPDLKHGVNYGSDSDCTPDMMKLNNHKAKHRNSDCFGMSNNTTPSTISPLPNGHNTATGNLNTPQVPIFDLHLTHNEDGEFMSLYIVRTDNDLGMDMCKEFQRLSKRYTIDPNLGDVSVSTSPSSVTSTGMYNLPNRTSFASIISTSSTSSNRTSDGAFVVPQPPRKSVSHPSTVTVKGYEALMAKLQEMFAHVRETTNDYINQTDEKVTAASQASGTSHSNGNASPEEMNKCNKATPKSSLKKTRVRGRRPMSGKTKRAILPPQIEEPEYMHGINSPEIVMTTGENGNMIKSPKEEKVSLVGTPKSINKLKQKRSRPISPRPATPVEKVAPKPDYPGYASDTVVLAKWVDRRYYSGKVLEVIEPNKYLIKFDDEQTKVLLDDFIIFGDTKTLPLQGQSVYATVDEDQHYEPCLVMSIEENDRGTVTYRCVTDGELTVCVTASELYVTEDQARLINETCCRPPSSAPSTPRRRGLRELDLDNIIEGPRSVRSRDKGSSSARKRVISPKSPKASTSGVKSKNIPVSRKRLASESSEMSESSNSAPPRIEEVAGVEPEVQKTPKKIDGVKAGPLQLKGAAKQNIGKKNSKLAKFENDEDTIIQLGPIPPKHSKLFAGLHFLLTCTEVPRRCNNGGNDRFQETRHYSSEEDGDSTTAMAGTDCEELLFSDRPFNKERLKEQLETGGGIVHGHFDDIPKNKYSVCKLIAPRPCVTAKYIQCVAADIRALSHAWVIMSCIENKLKDYDSYALPCGWSILKDSFVNWSGTNNKRNTSFFKDKVILLCGEQDTFVKFWERVCTLNGATTRMVNEENLNMTGALALITEWDCPHEVQNKANQDNIPLVSTTWVVQCLIENRIISPTAHDRFSFMYTEPE